jgi:hypothetical protein
MQCGTGTRGFTELSDNPKAALLSIAFCWCPMMLQYAHLLAEGNNLKTEAAAETEEPVETGKIAQGKLSHEFRFIGYGYAAAPALTA